MIAIAQGLPQSPQVVPPPKQTRAFLQSMFGCQAIVSMSTRSADWAAACRLVEQTGKAGRPWPIPQPERESCVYRTSVPPMLADRDRTERAFIASIATLPFPASAAKRKADARNSDFYREAHACYRGKMTVEAATAAIRARADEFFTPGQFKLRMDLLARSRSRKRWTGTRKRSWSAA